MNFLDYVAQVDRAMKAPVSGDLVNIEIDSITSVLATVVEHSDTHVTLWLDNPAWNLLDRNRLLSEGTQRQRMAEFVLTFERNGSKVQKKFLHQPPMEAAGITQDFVRNIAKSNKIHETMAEQGYKLRHAVASLVETDQLPESEVTVIARNPSATEARVTFECVFKKTDSNRNKMFLETVDCSTKSDTAQYWSLPVKTRG
jgi:hypothetical protein